MISVSCNSANKNNSANANADPSFNEFSQKEYRAIARREYAITRNQTSKIKSVFQNGPMVEAWAVYCEQMMIENGRGNNAPEIWLTLYTWRLRECSNVLIDYGIQCLNYSKGDVQKLLKNETFQEDAQIEENIMCNGFTSTIMLLLYRS